MQPSDKGKTSTDKKGPAERPGSDQSKGGPPGGPPPLVAPIVQPDAPLHPGESRDVFTARRGRAAAAVGSAFSLERWLTDEGLASLKAMTDQSWAPFAAMLAAKKTPNNNDANDEE